MTYPSLAEEITDLIHHRLQRADRHERGRILESALNIYSRTGSVVAFFRNQPIAFYHERSGRAFTLHGILVELQQCEMAPMPRIPYLDQVLEEGGEVAPQHGRNGRAPPPCSYDRYEPSRSASFSTPSSSSSSSRRSNVHGWMRRRPSVSSAFRHTKPKDTPSAGHRRHDGYDRFSRDDRFTYDDRSAYDDRFTRDDHFDYDDRFTRAAGRAASRAAEDDARYQFFERAYGSDYFTDRRGPAAPHGHYAGFPDRSESFGHNTFSRGPATSSGYSTNTSYRHVDPSGFHTETRGPAGGYSTYSSSGFYAGEPRRPATSSGYPGASSFYNTETRGPSSGASGYSSNDSYSYSYAGGGGPRGRPESPKYNTETRGPGRSSSPGSNYSGSGYSGYNSSSSSNYDSRPPPRAQPQPHPREPPANGSMADRFEWLLRMPYGFYEILGVDRGANEAQIKKAYRKLALVHHPDKHAGGAAKAEAHRRFQAINEANETLSDASKKHAYDGNLGMAPN